MTTMTQVVRICTAYERGVAQAVTGGHLGHPSVMYEDPELAEAYEIGFDYGMEQKVADMPLESIYG